MQQQDTKARDSQNNHPPSESASEEDSEPEQLRRPKDKQKNLALIANTPKTLQKLTPQTPQNSSNTQKQECGPVVQQSVIQMLKLQDFGHYAKEMQKANRVRDSTYHKEKMLIDEQEDEKHFNSYMVKVQEVPNADSGTDAEPLE
ncbi:hypothetical protein Tco_1293614 [Tanacetum coccineum]